MAKRKRASLSKRTRFEVFKRDGFRCAYCGDHPPAVKLVVDHIVPVAEGGLDEESNLITACEVCNQGKAARLLCQAPAPLAERAEDIAEREEQLRGYYAVVMAQRERIEADAWIVADLFMDCFGLDGIRTDWLRSIKNFNEKLGLPEVLESMEIAVAKKHYASGCFTYFCGVCWSKIRERTNG